MCCKWCNPAPLNGSAPNLVVLHMIKTINIIQMCFQYRLVTIWQCKNIWTKTVENLMSWFRHWCYTMIQWSHFVLKHICSNVDCFYVQQPQDLVLNHLKGLGYTIYSNIICAWWYMVWVHYKCGLIFQLSSSHLQYLWEYCHNPCQYTHSQAGYLCWVYWFQEHKILVGDSDLANLAHAITPHMVHKWFQYNNRMEQIMSFFMFLQQQSWSWGWHFGYGDSRHESVEMYTSTDKISRSNKILEYRRIIS